MKTISVVASFLVFAFASASAYDNSAAASAELKKLDFMVGDWAGKVKMFTAGAVASEADSRIKAEFVLDGMYQRFQWDTDVPRKGKTTMLGYVAYDLQSKAYRSWTFDNANSMPLQNKGQLKKTKLVLKSKPFDNGNGLCANRVTFEPKGAKELHVVIEVKQGETWSKWMEGTLIKK